MICYGPILPEIKLSILNTFFILCVPDYLAEGVDLTGIDVLETDRRFMRQARKEVETQGQKMLEQGLDTQVGGHMAGHVTRSYGGEM